MESNTNSKNQNTSQNSQTQEISQNKNEMQNTTMLINGKPVDSVISYADLKTVIPGRKDFLDPNESSKIDRLISSREEIAFLPTYLMETHMQDEKYQKAKYKIILMGIFKDGRRVNVILDNIEPYFEVRIPDGDSESMKNQIADIIERLNRDELTTPVKKSLISAKPFKYYQPNKSKFLRLYYTKTKNRQAAINLIRKEGYQTTSDDLNSYYRVVCRDYLTTFSSWASLAKYEPCQSTLLKGETYRLNIADYKIYSGIITNDMLRDKSMSMCWDVETWSPDGAVPQPEVRSNAIFCLSTTFHWVNEKDPFLKICFCDYPANAKPGYLSVICGTELNIIKAFSEVYAKLRPEFIFGFNDSDYDWPWLVKRAAQTKGTLIKLAGNFDATKPWQEYTDDYVMKFNYKKEHVKVEATNYVDGYSLMMPGYIPIDVRTIFRQLYPTAEYSSLKWFLAKNKLGGKEDMPYEKMFKIYTEYREFMDAHGWNPKEDADVRLGKKVDLDVESLTQEELITYSRLKADLGEINSYCVVDAIRCHDLVKIRSVIMDKREVSHKSYCSLYDAFYRANGMKVRNLTIAIGQTEVFKTRFSNINNSETEDGKYPGGFVLPPKKGLRISKLSIEERIAKAKVFADKGKTSQKDNPCFEWLATTLEEVTDFYETIKDRGCVLDEEQLASLEETRRLEGKPKLPKKFKDFLRESIGRPITGLDFSSLYPSLIRAYNFSPEYCILDKKLARDIEGTGQRLTKVDFDFNGRRRVAYFIWHNNKLDPKEEGFQFGIYPYILDGLFNERAALKKKMKVFDHRKEQIEAMTKEEQNSPAIAEEYIDVCFNKNYLNCKQNALKVFMNTFYGECGNKLSPFFVLEVAGGITTYGKKNIQFAHAFVKEEGCNVYYGDSVVGETPVIVKDYSGFVGTFEIKSIGLDEDFIDAPHGKQIYEPQEAFVWSDEGWQKIKKVIRHKTNKKMYRILTHTGLVDVTEDHSLLNVDGTSIKPGEVSVGDVLLHADLPDPIISETELISEDEAWVLGLFVAEGNCGMYKLATGYIARKWAIVNQEISLLEKAKDIMEEVYPDYSWIIYDQLESSRVYSLQYKSNGVHHKRHILVEKYRDLCYDGNNKIVPSIILRSAMNIKKSFLEGYYYGDGDKSSNNNTYNMHLDQLSKRCDMKGQVTALSFYWLLSSMGYNVSINCRLDMPNIYRLTFSNSRTRKEKNVIKKIIELPDYEDYVYDLETENHHFSAGIGRMVVHNTDSLYLSVPERVFKEFDLDFYTGKISKLDYWTRMVETSFSAINPIRDGVNKAFLENNGTKFLSMAYEEILYPVAFTAKKKYFGIPHENIANFQPKELFVRGLEVKKRGVSDLLKENFMEIMWTSVNPANLYDLVELVLAKIDMIYAQKWDPKYFIQTGVYRPTKNNVKIKRFVERMAEKKVEIKPNERFDYVIVKKYPYTYDLRGRKKELSIGDKLEMKETVIAEGMEIDLDYYMQGSVNGQLARLITYHEMFEVDPIDNTVEERDVAEVKAYKNACKFIENYCSKYYAKYNTFGKTYQKIYKTASKYFGGAVGETDDMASMLLSANVDYDDFETWFMEFTNKAADKLVVGYGEKYITDELNKVNEIVKNRHSSDEEPITKQELNREIKERRNEMLKMLQKVYYNNRNLSIKNVRENSYKETISILRTRIRDSFEQLMKLYKVYNSGIESVIEILKDKLAIDNQLQAPTQEQTDYKFEDFDVEIDERLDTELSTKAQAHVSKMFADPKILSIINLMKALYGHTVAAHLYIKRTYSIVDYLKQRRNNEVRAVVRPDDSVIREAIQRSLLESKDELMKIDI